MTDCNFTGNTGDGLYQEGLAKITGCEFTGNSGSGLISDLESSRLTVTDSTFSDNGSDGMKIGDVASVNVSNSVFSGNNGAGIRNVAQAGGKDPKVDVTSCLFVKNADSGVNSLYGADMNIRVTNSLFWNNTGFPGVAMAQLASVSYLFSDFSACNGQSP
jgi:hypothetical protein